MKKVVLLTILTASVLLAQYCTPSLHSNTERDTNKFSTAIQDINNYIKQRNNQVENIYKNINTNQAQNISDGFDTKKRLLTNIRTLSREDDIAKSEDLFEIGIKKELDSLLIDAWSVE